MKTFNKILFCILILSSYLCKGQSVERDTMILVSKADYFTNSKPIIIKYYFLRKNYKLAVEFIKLRQTPYMELSEKKRARLVELHPYIIKEEEK